MSTRVTTILIAVALVGTVLAGVFLWPRLPDPMASHWNISDEVDGFTSRFWGVFMIPILSLGMVLLFMLLPEIDPLKANIAKFRPTFNVFILLVLIFLAYIWKLSILWNLGFTTFKMSTAMLPAVGLLFIFVAYLLSKARRNWFIGIRTPWTLSSDHVWDATHRLGSILYFVSGVLALVGSVFGRYAYWFVLLPILVSSVALVAYSYFVFRAEKGRQAGTINSWPPNGPGHLGPPPSGRNSQGTQVGVEIKAPLSTQDASTASVRPRSRSPR